MGLFSGSNPDPHKRCESIEALLRGRINDLESELDASREREKEMLDRLLVAINPDAAQRLASLNRSHTPTPAPPVLERGAKLPGRPLAHMLPGQHQQRPTAANPRPSLTPVSSGHRPSAPIVAQDAASEALAARDSRESEIAAHVLTRSAQEE